MSSDLLIAPPIRYSCVTKGIYRGSYPLPRNIDFLRGLQLRTILTIAPDPLEPLSGLENVEYIHIESAAERSKSKKKRGLPITSETVQQALQIIEDPERQPVYVHCLNGAQVTCLVIGCYRRSKSWSLNSVLAEFSRYTDYDRVDGQFIETFSGAGEKLSTCL